MLTFPLHNNFYSKMLHKAGDRYRREIPIETITPKPVSDLLQKPPVPVITNDGKRLDSRTPCEFRQIYMKTGVISVAAGSAYIEMDKAKVICGVYGPRQSTSEYRDKAEIHCDVRFATFSNKNVRKGFQQDTEEEEMGIRLMQALEVSILVEKFPKSVIEINVIILESNGNALVAAIIASSLALADAGIVVYDLVAACTVSKVKDCLLLDPTEEEKEQQTGSILLALMPGLNQVTQLVHTGELDIESTVKAIDLCVSGCMVIHETMKQHFKRTVKKKKITNPNKQT